MVILWFYSYSLNRSQSILDEFRIPIKLLETTSGVSKESILEPILFLIVMNAEVRRIIYCKHGLFDDDNFMMLSDTVDAQAIADWVKEHSLELNLSKT
ncbi:Protein of unknown function, partial [Cotesia congregata]